MSPGGRTPYSLRRMPELPPSSAAVTTAVIPQSFGRCRRSPLKTTGSPVPPLAWGPGSGNHNEEAVDASGDEATVRDRDERRRVEHDVVVALARPLHQLLESRQLERLVGRHRAHARRQNREVELGKTPH